MKIRAFVIRELLWRSAIAVVAIGFTCAALSAQTKKPDFSGNWEVDQEKSTRPDVIREIIDHKEPKVVITSTPQSGDNYTIRFTTDRKDNLNIIGGREMTARTTWEEDKLVTLVRDPNGMQLTEVRSLSADGRVQTVEGFMDPGRKQAMFRRVMIKR